MLDKITEKDVQKGKRYVPTKQIGNTKSFRTSYRLQKPLYFSNTNQFFIKKQLQ